MKLVYAKLLAGVIIAHTVNGLGGGSDYSGAMGVNMGINLPGKIVAVTHKQTKQCPQFWKENSVALCQLSTLNVIKPDGVKTEILWVVTSLKKLVLEFLVV